MRYEKIIKIVLESTIIHDLKSPIAAIAGSADLFLDGLLGNLTEPQQKYLKNIRLSSKLVLDMLTDLQNIIDLEEGKLELNQTYFLADEVLARLAWLKDYAAREEKNLRVKLPEKFSLRVDKEITFRVLENLIFNSLKQIRQGETIHLEIKTADGRILFEIKNFRLEIPAESLVHLFDRNFKTKYPELKNQAGPGLGLYFCKLAVEAQGGKISAEFVKDKDCRFYFYLPTGAQAE